MSTSTRSTLIAGVASLLSLGSLAVASPSFAQSLDLSTFQTSGDVLTSPTQADLTNAFSDGTDDLGPNFNISGNNPTPSGPLETFLGIAPGSLNFTGSAATEGSAIAQTFSVLAGDVLSFDFNFLTNEGTFSTNFNDFAFFTVDGGLNDVVVQLADTSDASNPSSPFAFETGFTPFSFTFANAGTFNVGIGLVDDGDFVVSSGLSVRNAQLTSTTSVPEPTSVLVLLGLGAFGTGSVLKRQRQA